MHNELDSQYQAQRKFSFKPGEKNPDIEELSVLMQTVLDEMQWMLDIVEARIAEIENGERKFSFVDYAPPALSDQDSAYTHLVKDYQLSAAERLLLMVSLIPHLAPEELTVRLRDESKHVKLRYAEFGGHIDLMFTNFVPSLQTVLFLLAGNDKTNAVFYKMALSNTGKLVREGIVRLNSIKIGQGDDQELNYVPTLTQEYLLYLQSGHKPRPDYGRAFPATWVTTGLDWQHLVLDQRTQNEIQEIMRWVEHGQALTESSEMFNVSFPCLFYGPPGTGKSLTAKLIGKKYGKDVFRVDLSMIVSKYIGETEKNLAHLFDRAHGKDWILFFDEAESLFSKRTEVNSSNDKWANLEVSYLLQRMEEHLGLTILATNLKDNMDAAMTRRFQSIIYFPAPKEAERKILWQNLLPAAYTFSDTVSLDKLASFKLSGANIANVIKDSCLAALAHDSKVLKGEWLTRSIKKELIKEKRTP